MILKIKTTEIDFQIEGAELKLSNYIDSTTNKEFLMFIKAIITDIAEKTIKIKEKL